MSEELVIEHCSPTLAGIKTGSMFTTRVEEGTDIYSEIRGLNNTLRDKGLRVILLKQSGRSALIYIYRPDHLKKDLSDPKASVILKNKGYDCSCPEVCIVQLVRHLKEDAGFPHEVGLFLGYPPSDVEGFMKDPSKGVKCCGCWKAYSEPEKARKTFKRFNRCTEEYRRMNKMGKSLAQLAVSTDEA
ncbi:MAG: DUF3793 family protein [Lachnospiraceae bacterium]|nr:DUF3793 family protein [Lachnospiraceae bacterium]